MTKDCLYCGLRFADTTRFCPNCGRPTESGFLTRSLQESEVERLHRELKKKDEQIRQLVLILTQLGESSDTAHANGRGSSHGYSGIRASATTRSCSRSSRKTKEEYGL